MHRFSVIYLLRKQYHHIDCETHSEADIILEQLSAQEEHKPIGIYDAKTELFYWEPVRQHQYDKATIERQGKIATHIIQIAQSLRSRDEMTPTQTSSIAQLLET
ncbi:hypothetical protein IC229_31655 [Spirosoma sp. BT702]|uniref:Uncharacterized protein n=1 Tax=Spirosoma profusum TaxID=2771354 RepID=A0A927GAM5_9BACT|nr:hypothetical protein [Spirosoma profusum]MBD2705220.1 hypothetical protein [Spirosoma profusum]